MKLHKTAAVSVLAIAALGVASGTAHAESSAPPVSETVLEVGTVTAAPLIPVADEMTQQQAYDNLVRQIEQGWMGGGAMNAQIGTGIGAVVGCVLFLFVGCIPGAAIGGAIGAISGINNANPDVQPAFFDLIETLN